MSKCGLVLKSMRAPHPTVDRLEIKYEPLYTHLCPLVPLSALFGTLAPLCAQNGPLCSELVNL